MAILLTAAAATVVSTSDYDRQRTSAIAKCEAIRPSDYQTGVLFNPAGYRSYYVRSVCFQETAVRFRDDSLCSQVRQRWSLFFSSWGYSSTRCRDLVRQGAAADVTTLEEMKRLYEAGGIVIRDFRIEPNGNGRDFDIIPSLAGTYSHRYRLTFEILDPDGSRPPALLYADGQYLDANSNLRLYIRQSDLRQRLPNLAPGRSCRVRATVSLDIGTGGPSGYWSPAFLERVFAARERTRSLTKDVRF